MIAITIMAKTAHLNNSLFGLALMYGGLNCGFGIMTYMGFLKSVPAELEEAAMIDGCGVFRSMVQIVFPLLKPATVTLGYYIFYGAGMILFSRILCLEKKNSERLP